MDGKIFGIGLSRTGTRSLARALAQLGFKAAHYSVAVTTILITEDGLVPDYAMIDAWDALTDIPVTAVYDQLDRHYSQAKFILTVREKESWLDSCERHYAASRESYMKKHGLELERILTIRRAVYGQEVFSREHYGAVYDRHVAEVSARFRNRKSDLLTLDICAGDGWQYLCRFLGRPVPAAPFPHENLSRPLELADEAPGPA